MATVTDNTIVVNPETGAAVVLAAGADVPEWAEDMVGDHLVEVGADGDYQAMKVAALKLEIERRNDDREDDKKIVPDGTKKDDLVAALTKDDAPSE